MINVTWTGAAGLRFDTGETTILIDPYYTRIGLTRSLLRPIQPDTGAIGNALPDMEKIDAVIVGHTHSDHALDVPFIVGNCNAKLVGSHSLDSLMTMSGMSGRTRVCRGGECIKLNDDAVVTMIRSTHGFVIMGQVPFQGEIQSSSRLPMKANGYRVGTAFAPKLELKGTTFLHNGSANFIESEMAGHRCDVLFLCVPGWKKKDGYPERLIEMTQARSVVLFHFDDFSKPHKRGAKTQARSMFDLPGLMARIESLAPEVKVIIPEIDEPMLFDEAPNP